MVPETQNRALVCKLAHPDRRWMLLGTTTRLHPYEQFAFIAKGIHFSTMVITNEFAEECDHQYAHRIERHVQNGFELIWQTQVPVPLMERVGLNAYARDWAFDILRQAVAAMEPGWAWN